MIKAKKRLIIIFLLISALMLPTSAYAKSTTETTATKQSSFQFYFGNIFSSLFGKKNSNDEFEKEKERESQKEKDMKSQKEWDDELQKHKESADTWDNWYCY